MREAFERLESALSVATLIGETAASIGALIDAAGEARAVASEWRELCASACDVCGGNSALMFHPCAGCGR